MKLGRAILILEDGRTLDVSDLTVEEFMALLAREDITPDDIRELRHTAPVRKGP